MTTDDARRAEHAKYVRAYATERPYRMSDRRRLDATADLSALPVRGALLDVSCGYGDMLRAATELGFDPCRGTEIVDHLCDGATVVRAWAHELPFDDGSFNVAIMTDVIEHLIPGDDEAACREMRRVTRRHVIITANNKPSCRHIGEDLHINCREYEEWGRLFGTWFAPAEVTRLKRHHDVGPNASACWRIDLP